jgi:hypothetical protein
MSASIIIKDPATGIEAEVDNSGEKHGLVVATRPLKTFENSIRYFSNDDYGVDMNQDATFGGTPIRVHDGVDSVLWTGSNIVSTVDFNSATRPYLGTYSINFSTWANSGDICQITKGSSQDLTSYSAITMWINVDSNWITDSVSFYGWDTGTGLIVGNDIKLEDYANINVYNVWHAITIPLSDMGLTDQTIDSFRFQYVQRVGSPVNFFIDELIIQETGAPIKFTIKPNLGTWLHVYDYTFTFVDAYTGILADATMPLLSYDKILNETLATGLSYNRIQGGDTKFTQTVKALMDIMEFPGTYITGTGSDGTNGWITIRSIHTDPFILKSEDDDSLSFSVNDDMSGLIRVRISAGCKIEKRVL